MSFKCFVSIFLCVNVLQFTYCLRHSSTSGPFKSSVISIQDCSSPAKPYIKNPPVVFLPTADNNTMSGSITFLRDTKNMKVRIRGFVQRNEKWESAYLINNVDCHGMVLHLVCVTLNIKYDRKSCVYLKGSYYFKNLDVDQLLHFWISKAEYGHNLWRAETYSSTGTFMCKEFDTMIEPA